jgi:prepilin-type N-terminal cleavage/methylation domain-containing protein
MDNRNMKWRGSVSEEEAGFTLIELLIVIVVLGILAAIVVFALNGVTSQGTAAACQSDAKTVGIGIAALEAENPTTAPLTATAWKGDLLPGSALQGAPFLQSWPSPSGNAYGISVAIAGGVKTSDATPVIPSAGDVLVTATSNGSKVFDATVNPTEACSKLSA